MNNKNTKTILFASLIAAMILPFNMMDVQAQSNSDVNNYKEKLRKHLPGIKTFDLVDASPELFKQKIENLGKVQIHFGNTTKTLSLEEHSNRSPDFDYPTTINVDEQVITLPEVKTYRGSVIGIPDSKVVMTIVDKEIDAKIKIGDSTWYMESTKRYDSSAPQNEHYIYNVNALKSETTVSQSNAENISDTVGAATPLTNTVYTSIQTTDYTPQPKVTYVGYDNTVTANVIVVCDQEFWNTYSYYSYYEIEKVLNKVAENYASLGINVQMSGLGCDSNGEYLTSTDALALLNELKSNWQSHDTDRDIVMLFTGKDITALNNDGFTTNNVGQANPTFPYYGSSGSILALDNKLGESYAVSQMRAEEGWITPYNDSAYLREINVSHEIGHLFGALHENAIHECGFEILDECYYRTDSLMLQTVSNYNTDQFTDTNRQIVEQNSRLYLN